jgi:hypothetical protein
MGQSSRPSCIAGSVATTVEETGIITRRSELVLSNAQQCPKYAGVPRQIVPGDSQNLAFANHVYRLDC